MPTPPKTKFYKEFLTLCQKYKVNAQAKIEFKDLQVEIDVHGSWDIRSDQEQLEVYEVPPVKKLFSINGTKSI